MNWQERLALVEDTMRDISRQTDPQEMVRIYAERIQQLTSVDRRLSLSRVGLTAPEYRITRSTTWDKAVNPWTQKEQLPLLSGGLLADLLYLNRTTYLEDLSVDPTDPAAAYLSGFRSLLAIPNYDEGESRNMVVLLQQRDHGFEPDNIPDLVWRSNLFGKATKTLVLKDQLETTLLELDREMKVVGEIQRALLPKELPKTPRMDIAAHYQPANRAGGDYYDFFELPDGKWGLFIGDVSGHGTPAAVMMAVTHCIAHTHPGPSRQPGDVLTYLNKQLVERYAQIETFVTAFYGVFDPQSRRLSYACAGHNPPRLKRCQTGSVIVLDKVGGFPLGIMEGAEFPESSIYLEYGDQLILYTDGITETNNPHGELYGTARMDDVLAKCGLTASELIRTLLKSVDAFAANTPPLDDRTLIVLRAS